jgi:hypothetical protein
MFNLIVAVISIALIAAMAAASIFYGGSAFSSGTAQAQATTLINNGQQIGGAQQLYMIDNSGNRAEALSTLTSGAYLQAAPTPPSVAGGFVAPEWAINDDGKIATIAFTNPGGNNSVSATICKELFNQGGATGTVPETGIKAGAPTAALLGTDQFGCFSDGDPLVVTVAVKL